MISYLDNLSYWDIVFLLGAIYLVVYFGARWLMGDRHE